jgi:hypothetical protein
MNALQLARFRRRRTLRAVAPADAGHQLGNIDLTVILDAGAFGRWLFEEKVPSCFSRIAEHIMQAKNGDFDPALLEDRYRTALVENLRTKKRQMPIAEGPVEPSSQNVINLMRALRRSMESERGAVAKPPPRRASVWGALSRC